MTKGSSQQAIKSTKLRKVARVFLGLGLVLNLLRALMFQYHQDHQLDVHTVTFIDLSIHSWGWLLIVGAGISFFTSVMFYGVSRWPPHGRT